MALRQTEISRLRSLYKIYFCSILEINLYITRELFRSKNNRISLDKFTCRETLHVCWDLSLDTKALLIQYNLSFLRPEGELYVALSLD